MDLVSSVQVHSAALKGPSTLLMTFSILMIGVCCWLMLKTPLTCSINRSSLLWNIRILWPRASRFIYNTYRGHSPLVIRGSSEPLFSKEGVVQGDPLSMFMYAIGTIPLINSLKEAISTGHQIWYADDASAIGDLATVRHWFDCLMVTGPRFGYFPEPQKCCLIVKESLLNQASLLFGDLGLRVTTSSRFLGGVIGDLAGKTSYVSTKVQGWIDLVHSLSSVALTQPQAAYSAFIKLLQHQWTYLQRVTPDCGHQFDSLESVISDFFIPALFGQECSSVDRLLFSLPIRLGGLSIRNPVSTSSTSYTTSRLASKILISSIKGEAVFSSYDHICQVRLAQSNHSTTQRAADDDTFNLVLDQVDCNLQKNFKRARDCLSSWLNVLPCQKDNFDLTCNEFRDALNLRYSKPLLHLPPTCDGCSSLFTTSHALDCKKGGLVTQRHNEVWDLLYDLASQAWTQVTKEPIIREALPGREALVGDISIRGVWQPQSTAVFDVRVTDSDAPSYLRQSPMQVLRAAEREKKAKYSSACEALHVSFTPLCMTVDGLIGSESNTFIRRLADQLSIKWDHPYSSVLYWLRTRLSFALVRATNLCIRGSRSKIRSLNFEDGAGISLLSDS